MSISYSIDHAVASVEDVSVEVAAKSEMVLAGSGVDPKTNERFAQYRLASGDNAFPAIVEFRVGDQNRSYGAVRHIVVRFSTWAVESNSVSGIDTRKPITGIVTIDTPADYTIEVADLDDFIGNLFSYLYLSVTTKVRDTTWLRNLLFGAPTVI
jgi:hypothetical protein